MRIGRLIRAAPVAVAILAALVAGGPAAGADYVYSAQLDTHFTPDGILLDCAETGGVPPKCYDKPFDMRFYRTDDGRNPYLGQCYRTLFIGKGVYTDKPQDLKPSQAEKFAAEIQRTGAVQLGVCDCRQAGFEALLGLETLRGIFPADIQKWVWDNRPNLVQSVYDLNDRCRRE